jgi:integrase
MPSLVIPRGGKFGARLVVHGRQEWLGTHETEELAHAAIEDRRAELAGKVLTVGEWADRWAGLPGARGPRSRRTVQHNAKMVRAFVDAFATCPLTEVPDRAWLTLVAEAPSSARYVRTMLEDAVRFHVLEVNPLDGLVPTWRQPEIVPPARDDLDAIAAELERHGQWARAFAAVSAWSGLRFSEVARLRAQDVVLAPALELAGMIEAPPAMSLTVRRKGDILRTSILFEPGTTVLRDYMVPCSPERLLFPSLGGCEVPRTTYSTIWCEAREKVGLPLLRFHDLRHFHATWLLDQGASDMDVAIQLGHRDGGVQVRRTYGHPSRERALARLRTLTRQAA